jgi:phenylalanyl-tRNA synthetase beta chain
VSELFSVYSDMIYEIGLTPNRSDAMSHRGVARDVCAYLSYHEGKEILPVNPAYKEVEGTASPQNISIENADACRRYSGVHISDITVKESPQWLKDRLQAIGQKSINNIVDITNYILHESGQPLHAFDADKIAGNKIVVKNWTRDTPFTTLDEKERKLHEEDLIIGDAEKPMCMAGVYGGLNSGVSDNTKNIFLESAWFHPISIRRTSMRHGLRTDAATRFEKGVDISQTMNVLHRAAALISETAGGKVHKAIDIYPEPAQQKHIRFSLSFLKKLSGKSYDKSAVLRILTALGFEVISDQGEELELGVPFSKNDINIGADIVEEIMRIDGLDNIMIPDAIRITPGIQKNQSQVQIREKIAGDLAGMGFHEIMTNSIVNSQLYAAEVQERSVKMMNSLSSELDMMRPDMLMSGLQVIARNLHHKNSDLQLFDMGKTYHGAEKADKSYFEEEHLALYTTGTVRAGGWNQQETVTDIYLIKGVVEKILPMLQVRKYSWREAKLPEYTQALEIVQGNQVLGCIGIVSAQVLKKCDIKQVVYAADLNIGKILAQPQKAVPFRELPKYPAVHRDLALVVDKKVSYSQVEQIALSAKMEQLRSVKLFDVFESDKLGADKKSMAVSFTFLNEEKTMTDEEIDGQMKKLIVAYEKGLNAEIRK